VRLFLERAAGAATLENPTAEDLRLIGRITAALDGLPLAIELAASRAGTLGLGQLGSLDDRLGVIGAGSRTARGRHQTMSATIDWSYQLLPLELQAVLRRLSVFIGGFDLDAATAITSGLEAASNVTRAVSGLVERSLLSYGRGSGHGSLPRDRGRYMLLETIRQFALSRLEAEEGSDGLQAVREAHSRYFANLAARASGALVGWQQGQWLAALETEYANIAAALAYLINEPGRGEDALRIIVQLDRFWHGRGHLAACATLLNSCLEISAAEIDADVRCAALKLAGQATVRRDPAAARARFMACLEAARLAGDDHHVALALAGLAEAYLYSGDEAGSRTSGQEAVDVARRVGDPVLLGECLVSYGLALTDDVDLSKSVHEEAISVTRRAGDRIHFGYALNNLGNSLLAYGEVSIAAEYFQQTRAVFAEIGSPDASPLINLGWVYLEQEDPDGAQGAFTESVRLARRVHSPREGAYGLLGLACTSVKDGNFERGASLFGFADAELEGCGEQSWLEPERTFRQDGLRAVRVALGSGADQAYDAGRIRDRQEMYAIAVNQPDL
jgi:non-specific serine/threonine protein kinase